MRLNKSGFTLVELLAVVIILSVLMAVMIPSVNSLLNEHRKNQEKDLKNSLVSAAKMYISDNRYDVQIDGFCSNTEERNIMKIKDKSLNDSNIPIQYLVDSGNIKMSLDKSGNKVITNPNDQTQILNLSSSYVPVRYSCKNKDYVYSSPVLNWN